MKAALNYLIPSAEKPVYIASTGGSDAALSIRAEFKTCEVDIVDARTLETPPNLDLQGFCLVEHQTSVENFYQFEQCRSSYEAEITELLLAQTGARDVLIFDHTLRSDSPDLRGQHASREPATVIHNDYTDESAEKRLRDLVSADDAEALLRKRYAIVNVWRPLFNPVQRSPLACCDASTISPEDLIASERRAEERIGELELVSFNSAHRWYWYSDMLPSEALLIKTFDSSLSVARRSIHSAFENADASSNAPPRESIESRSIVFFD